jgi:DNA-directed RNA polymerase subunit RPC12/RpoP
MPNLFQPRAKCKECGKEFDKNTGKQKFCCYKCSNRFQGKQRQRIIDEYRARQVAAE